ncbi:unnamed protein product [Rotaria sp. Silwood1]|nr:unnamed protein product [Rotaria sp. Silwood1]
MPARQAIYKLAKKFDDTGSVEDSPRSDRPTTVRTEENIQLVSEAFARNPQICQRRASLRLDPTLLDRILWTDEATFQINGRGNRHDCVYWSDINPHFIIEQELYVPQVIVWGGIWSKGVVGPSFFEANVTSQNYLQMMKDNIIPQLEEYSAFQTMIWQQDSAPPIMVKLCASI